LLSLQITSSALAQAVQNLAQLASKMKGVDWQSYLNAAPGVFRKVKTDGGGTGFKTEET
jgi:hypothetical protein